jgi:carboxyl-terminal processing protease
VLFRSIDGQTIDDPSTEKVVRLIRGEPGTEVKMVFYRPSLEKEVTYTLKRERIRLRSVRNAQISADGIGYLQITQFSERTGGEFSAALKEL